MKDFRSFALVLFCALCGGSVLAQAKPQVPVSPGNQPAAPEPWKKIAIPQLPAFQAPLPKRIELANGMIVFLQEDHELPLITATARIRGGSLLEPEAKVGLVDLYGDVWRTGGTTKMTGDQMDDFLEARAAKLETGGNQDSTSLSLNCLKPDFDSVFALFLDLLHEPAFREDKLALAQEEEATGISRRNDQMGGIAAREASYLAYGKQSPYVRQPEYATIAAVTRADLVKWHEQFVHPNNILLGIVGDFDASAMEKRLRLAFESWPKGPAAPRPEIPMAPAKPGYYYVAKSGVNQSAIREVTLGIERNNPDYFAVEVMNTIFGGGFASRLFKHIRTEQGLAYSVGGAIGAGYDHPGVFRLSMGTKSATTAEGIRALTVQLESLLNEPVKEEEMKRAKDAILSSFIFRVDTPEKVLGERMAYEFYGYPLDFMEKFRTGIDKVTIDDVTRVAHKYVHPGSFAVLVVGNEEAGKQLATLGTVTKVDITIPGPPK